MVVQYILASRKVQKEVKVDSVPAEEKCDKGESAEKKDEDVEMCEEKGEEIRDNLDEKSNTKLVDVEEYYVKYRNFSYLHCEWKTEEELMKGDKRIIAKLKRFKQKQAQQMNIFENVRTWK